MKNMVWNKETIEEKGVMEFKVAIIVRFMELMGVIQILDHNNSNSINSIIQIRTNPNKIEIPIIIP